MWPYSQLNRIESLLKNLTTKVNQMALDYTALQTALTKETDATAALLKVFTALQAELTALASQITDPTAQAQINDFATRWQAQNDAIVAATLANTPAAPIPTPTPPPVPTP